MKLAERLGAMKKHSGKNRVGAFRQVDCPSCPASSGEFCLDANGFRVNPHRSRVILAESLGLRTIGDYRDLAQAETSEKRRLRRSRVRDEALEEAAKACDQMASDDALMLAAQIRMLKSGR